MGWWSHYNWNFTVLHWCKFVTNIQLFKFYRQKLGILELLELWGIWVVACFAWLADDRAVVNNQMSYWQYLQCWYHIALNKANTVLISWCDYVYLFVYIQQLVLPSLLTDLCSFDAHAVPWVGTQDTYERKTNWALSSQMVLKHQEALFTPWFTASSLGEAWGEHI